MALKSKAKHYQSVVVGSAGVGKSLKSVVEAIVLMGEYEALYQEYGDDAKKGEMIKSDYDELDRETLRVLHKKHKITDTNIQIAGIPRKDENGFKIDDESIAELDFFLSILPSTKKLHIRKDGNYKAARKKLHTKIIDDEVRESGCIRREKPIAILTGGLPGSGKSTFIRNNANWLQKPEIFKIDADDVRAKLPEYKGWNADQTHSETQDIVKALLAKVGTAGCSFDLIYDGTMNKQKKYIPLVERMKKEGYEVYVMYMKVPKEVSINRAMGRYQRRGRYVPLQVIEDGAAKGLITFNTLKGMVDGWVLVDGETQAIIEKGGKAIPSDRDYTVLTGTSNVRSIKQEKTKVKILNNKIKAFQIALKVAKAEKKLVLQNKIKAFEIVLKVARRAA